MHPLMHAPHYYSSKGNHILEQILTPLLESLGRSDEEKREIVLDGLQHVMSVKSHVVLPLIIPRLIQQPVNTRALSSLSSVAGHSLYKYLSKVIPALITALHKEEEEVSHVIIM